mmetsp:Transcript_15672/g.29281  ORF Transcript_15672/g.29281 Transcript_15672/m.29281 type:complete len:336 (+) Transcript_15672:194-1201(+)
MSLSCFSTIFWCCCSRSVLLLWRLSIRVWYALFALPRFLVYSALSSFISSSSISSSSDKSSSTLLRSALEVDCPDCPALLVELRVEIIEGGCWGMLPPPTAAGTAFCCCCCCCFATVFCCCCCCCCATACCCCCSTTTTDFPVVSFSYCSDCFCLAARARRFMVMEISETSSSLTLSSVTISLATASGSSSTKWKENWTCFCFPSTGKMRHKCRTSFSSLLSRDDSTMFTCEPIDSFRGFLAPSSSVSSVFLPIITVTFFIFISLSCMLFKISVYSPLPLEFWGLWLGALFAPMSWLEVLDLGSDPPSLPFSSPLLLSCGGCPVTPSSPSSGTGG